MDQTLNNPITQLQQLQLNERVSGLRKDFAAMNQHHVRTLPEAIFVTHFLPFFAGEPTARKPEELLAYWYQFAGNAYNPVNLLDSQGKLVIQVPPLQDNQAFHPIVDRNEDISFAIKHAREKSTISPILGQNLLAQSLAARMETMLAETENKALVEAWTALFQHYGKLGKTPIKPLVMSEDDEFEF